MLKNNLKSQVRLKVENFKEWNKNEIKALKEFCGEDNFNEKFKEFDNKVKNEYIKLMECIKKEIINFYEKLNKEINQNYKKKFGEKFDIKYITDINNEFNLDKNICIGGTIGSSLVIGGSILGLIFTGGLAAPIVFIVLGGFSLLTFGSVSLSLSFSTKKDKNEMFLLENEEIIEKYDDYLISFNEKAEERVREFSQIIDNINDLNMRDPITYLENKTVFLELINNYRNFIENLFYLFVKILN